MLEQIADFAVTSGLGNAAIVASSLGVIASTFALTITRALEAEDEAARAEAREALEAVPRVEDPEVARVTAEIEILRICPHLSTLDRLDGRKCPECDGVE